MLDYTKQIFIAQFDAALAMLNQCIETCPPEHWENKIAQGTFRWVTYHTLFFVDFYLSPNEGSFVERDLNLLGGDERGREACVGLSKDDSLAYLTICRQKMRDTITAPEGKRLIVGVRYAHNDPPVGGTLFVKHLLTHRVFERGAWKRS